MGGGVGIAVIADIERNRPESENRQKLTAEARRRWEEQRESRRLADIAEIGMVKPATKAQERW